MAIIYAATTLACLHGNGFFCFVAFLYINMHVFGSGF